MSEEENTIYKGQDTIRISRENLSIIDELYEEITGKSKEEKIPIGKFLMLCIDKCTQVIRPVQINSELIKENAILKGRIESILVDANGNGEIATKLQLELEDVKNENLLLQMQLKEASINSNVIILDFQPEIRKFIEGCFLIYKKENVANTYEEMFVNIITNFQKLGYLNFSKEDIEYLKEITKAKAEDNGGE